MTHHRRQSGEEGSIFADPTRQLEAFGRKVTATASQLMGPLGDGANQHYQNAIGELHRELRRPHVQRQVFSLAQASPRELIRSKLSVSEIQHRALTYLPDELLNNIPENDSPFSLFQGYEASLPDSNSGTKFGHQNTRGRRLLTQSGERAALTPAVSELRNEKDSIGHRLEMMTIRKNMCSTEITEIDNKIANLNSMRKIVLDRLAQLEQDEMQLEEEFITIETKLEDLEEEAEDIIALSGQKTPTQSHDTDLEKASPDSPAMEASFMSESIYQKLPSPKAKRPRANRRKSNFILHEHLHAGSKIRDIQAHNDVITALDFDAPFGTMVTAALDDTVRVWDLNAGRCMGLLEGHLSSVRCLQVEDNIVATGSLDASVRLWDLSQADYTPPTDNRIHKSPPPETDDVETPIDENDESPFDHTSAANSAAPNPSSMADCPLFTLSAHVAEVTALHFHNSTLVSGSADKTLRQWDLEKGRCVQTLDVLWAAAQASATLNANASTPGELEMPQWRSSRTPDKSADFVGALQCFDAALACGTADGMVRLWDLRSGQVHRSLVGHTGPVTCLQFDDIYMVTGSLDRSIRIWDLRTGSLFDAFAYINPVTGMMFDTRRIVAACGENVVKVYDKADGNQWDCGPGADQDDDGNVPTTVERVRIKDGYLVEGRKDGIVGVWSC